MCEAGILKKITNQAPGILFYILSALGFGFCWYQSSTIAFLILLPAVWCSTPHRWVGLMFIITYYLSATWELVLVFPIFFENKYLPVWGLIGWVVYAVMLSLPWLIFFPRKASSPQTKFCIVIGLSLITAFPPLGAIGWLHPLTAAGILYPSMKLYGLGFTILLIGFTAVIFESLLLKHKLNQSMIIATTLLLLIAITANVIYSPPDFPARWVAINTHLGTWPKTLTGGYYRELTLMQETNRAINQGAKLIVLPENIAGSWQNATERLWQPVFAQARLHHASIIIGAEKIGSQAQYGIIGVDISKQIQFIISNQPMPVVEWNPFDSLSPTANWRSASIINLDGVNLSVSICFEDLLAWPHIFAMLSKRRPDAVISIANQWFNRQSSFVKQTHAIEAWSRLEGVPLLRAANR